MNGSAPSGPVVEHEHFVVRPIGGDAIILEASPSAKPDPERVAVKMRAVSDFTRTRPLGSVFLLVNLEGVRFTFALAADLRQAARDDTPHLGAVALLGVSGIQKVFVMGAKRLSGVKLEMFDSADEARSWLVSQLHGDARRRYG